MSRIARAVGVGLPHHITQRGNYKQEVFRDDEDRLQYLFWVQKYSEIYGLTIHSFCLMPNHVHFIATPSCKNTLAGVFRTSHTLYSQYFNKKERKNGHLWQGRFFSCVLDEAHFIRAARYVERNPTRAGLTEKPWDWPWSSANTHSHEGESLLKLGKFSSLIGMTPEAWKKFIETRDEPDFLGSIRKLTRTGRPLGRAAFIRKVETALDRKLRPLPVGRMSLAQQALLSKLTEIEAESGTEVVTETV